MLTQTLKLLTKKITKRRKTRKKERKKLAGSEKVINKTDKIPNFLLCKNILYVKFYLKIKNKEKGFSCQWDILIFIAIIVKKDNKKAEVDETVTADKKQDKIKRYQQRNRW